MSEQQPGVEAVLAECGLDALSELEKTQTGNVIPFRSPRDIADLETKLRRLPELLGGADALRIAAVREALLLETPECEDCRCRPSWSIKLFNRL